MEERRKKKICAEDRRLQRVDHGEVSVAEDSNIMWKNLFRDGML
jgi:hypothetical protein